MVLGVDGSCQLAQLWLHKMWKLVRFTSLIWCRVVEMERYGVVWFSATQYGLSVCTTIPMYERDVLNFNILRSCCNVYGSLAYMTCKAVCSNPMLLKVVA
jgi:hypothetical protein